MKKSAIGHIVCPVCGHNDAEVKEDKNGHAFIFCTDCAAQVFTRNAHRDRKLRQRMRAVTVTDTDTVTEPPAQPAPLPTVTDTVTEKQAPKPAPKKASFFSPLIGVKS